MAFNTALELLHRQYDEARSDEGISLLSDDGTVTPGSETQAQHGVPAHIVRGLYVSHALSTWNTRVFEFGAVLYLATIFPGTLLPMSIYAFTRGVSAILFAPAVGQYIDQGNRLQVVQVSIVVQRLAVAMSCAIFYLLHHENVTLSDSRAHGLLALLACLACAEKLCSIMNMVAVEKDWVVVVAKEDQEDLRVTNSQMRRIDLLCKLLGPLCIALIDGVSTEYAICANFGMNLVSVAFEYFAIARVYHDVPELQESKPRPTQISNAEEQGRAQERLLRRGTQLVKSVAQKSLADLKLYFGHRAFLPSFAGALLYLTVLSFGGQMVTYLLSAGYDSTQVGIAQTVSVLFEVSATWVAPWLMSTIGPVRAGVWSSFSQLIPLAAGLAIFWSFSPRDTHVAASGLVIGTIVSRLGLRGLDLSVQVIVQQDVEAESRGAFSSMEAAWQNAFELLSYASTMIFARPSQFKWPTLISVIAVVLANLCYVAFTRIRRGHLVHLDVLTKCFSHERNDTRLRERGIERITSWRGG